MVLPVALESSVVAPSAPPVGAVPSDGGVPPEGMEAPRLTRVAVTEPSSLEVPVTTTSSPVVRSDLDASSVLEIEVESEIRQGCLFVLKL